MPNGHDHKEYGGHQYAEHDGTSNCQHGCGCWMGPARSGGPTGLDPGGACPKNPKDGKLLGGNADYEYVVTKRIQDLEFRLGKAEARLELVSPGEIKLVDELALAKKKLAGANELITMLISRQLLELHLSIRAGVL